MRRIYLDHAATTPVRPEAKAAMLACLDEYGNPSSVHQHGRTNRERLDRARDHLAELLGCRASEIIFTSGGTESNNLAIFGAARAAGGRRHVLISAVEHHAVLHPALALAAEGFEVELIPVDREGRVSEEETARMIRPDTALVSLMTANNELGAIQPVAAVASFCRANGTLVHTDAVQAFGHIPVSAAESGVDMLSISGHKFGGPPGAGALYVREGADLRPTMFGGAQERGRRGGTENAAAIAGMDAAMTRWEQDLAAGQDRDRRLTSRLRDRLRAIPGVWFNSPERGVLPGILNVGFTGMRAESLLLALDLEGVAASSGSACASGSLEPSHVLRAIGLTPEESNSSIRFSVGWTTTEEEIELAAAIIDRIVARTRKADSPRSLT